MDPGSFENIEILDRELFATLEPRLLGRVFHVTSHEVAHRVLGGEGILTNENGTLTSGFRSSDQSFFRLRGCVSLFDFRNLTPDGREKALYDASALNPNGHANNCPAFLFLNPCCFDKLLPWTLCDGKQMVVPYVECGHEGPIGCESITEALFVTVIPTPSAFGDLVRESYM